MSSSDSKIIHNLSILRAIASQHGYRVEIGESEIAIGEFANKEAIYLVKEGQRIRVAFLHIIGWYSPEKVRKLVTDVEASHTESERE